MDTERNNKDVRTELYRAAISCSHSIDSEEVILRRDPRQDGNALSQLADRLAAAQVALAAAPSPVAQDERESELLKALREVRQALQFANDSPNGGINDTLWMMHSPETVFDFIDQTLENYSARAATPAQDKQATPDELLDIARKTGLRSYLHGLNATDARGLLANFVAALPAGSQQDGYYLASFKRKSNGFVTWWGPNNAGYTPYLGQAGIYRKEELKAGYHDSECTVPVPVSFVRQFEQRVVDTGMSVCGETFWNAEKLRAAIAAMQAQGERNG